MLKIIKLHLYRAFPGNMSPKVYSAPASSCFGDVIVLVPLLEYGIIKFFDVTYRMECVHEFYFIPARLLPPITFIEI